jgi:peptidylprolyl isomerase
MGDIIIQLRDDKPITAGNFRSLTSQGLYDGTIFHRVMAGFMIQGGAIQSITVPNISDEIGNDNHNYNGTITMANTGAANSANSQFFINVADNNNLYPAFDTSYTVFGKVIGGMDVVMKISQVPVTTTDPNAPRPLQDVTLIRAIVLS